MGLPCLVGGSQCRRERGQLRGLGPPERSNARRAVPNEEILGSQCGAVVGHFGDSFALFQFSSQVSSVSRADQPGLLARRLISKPLGKTWRASIPRP